MSAERPAKRARSVVACRRCKHRKQRCDNIFPTCSNCTSAGETCSYESKLHPPDYVQSLEQRVAELERDLRRKNEQQSNQFEISPPSSALEERVAVRNDEDKANETGFDMLSSPSFLGTSSGYPLAQAVHAVIGSPQHNLKQPVSSTPPIREASTPDDALGRRLLHVYLSKVHPKHPFLSPRRIHRLHEARERLRPPLQPCSLLDRLHSFTLHMVYAIGARYHQLSQNDFPCSPDAYHAAAMEDLACLFQSSALEAIEGMLLLVIFQLRSPRPGELWSLLGLTMRHAISLGLHRRFTGPNLIDQRRKRVFWTAYMLERSIARTMGRPLSISDRDIDVDLPANVDEDVEGEEDMIVALSRPHAPTTMSAVIHLFQLTRIESKIMASVHRVDRASGTMSTAKKARLRQLLEQWRIDISLHVLESGQQHDGALVHYYATATYHILHYHLAVLLLLLPSLTSLPSSHPDFKACLASAGQVCQLYKQLHDRQSVLAYSIIALHATFVAGLTLIYCFIADATIQGVQFNSDIRACSTVLYVISERWPAARKVRDAFERMLGRTVESVDLSQPPAFATDEFDPLWSEIATQFWCDEALDRDDIWNVLGPWFELNDGGFERSVVGGVEARSG